MTALLSICIPTYNRADRLRVMLQAVLPQLADHGDKVELWISDNGSPDETATVVEEARSLGPLNYSCNSANIGVIPNVLKLVTELARGEFVWLLGDDDLLLPDALGRVLSRLEAHRSLDTIYLNFYTADYTKHWPGEALGGYRGPFEQLANAELTDRSITHWCELVRAESSMCTQLYAHIVKRAVWCEYWEGRTPSKSFSNVEGTYPHTCMLAEKLMNAACYYVGEPSVIVFNNGESWAEAKPVVTMLRYPELLRFYKKLRLPRAQARACERQIFRLCEPLLAERLQGKAILLTPSVGLYLRANWRSVEAWKSLARAIRACGQPRLISRLLALATLLKA
jgi:glycosyltransferase involved in cell wall biosynthesis